MSQRSEARLGLSEFMAELVAELSYARSRTDKANLNYRVDEITLELDIGYALTQPADAPNNLKPEFWVLRHDTGNGEGGPPSAQWTTGRLTLRLTPRLEDAQAGESEYAGTMVSLPQQHPADHE